MHEHTSHNDQASALRRLAMNVPHTVSAAPTYCWTVTSGKGGVGKSVFAMNFAIALSESGRKVLLVDADENLGKLDVMFGISPKYRIPDLLSESVSIADAVTEVRPNLFLLAGSSGSPNYPEISLQERNAFIASVRGSFNGITDVVFDTGAGIQEKVLSYAVTADQVIVVSHYEPVAILDAYAVIKMITAKRSDASLNIVMNKSLSATECDDAAEKLRTAVKHFLSGCPVPRHRAERSGGEPLHRRTGPAGRRIAGIGRFALHPFHRPCHQRACHSRIPTGSGVRMNKIIFQVGLLSFCVSVVIFSTLGNEMLEVVSKSFIVFIAAIVMMVGIVVATSMLSVKEKTETENNSTVA